MEGTVNRVMIAGTNSGCGKTTVTCAILQALKNRGLSLGAFKCGPDYIDPMFHSSIIGAKSANLDLNFFTKNILKYLLVKNGRDQDVNIIEGVMGFYDGQSLISSKASSYEIAEATRTPAVLVVGARGAAISILASIQGFLDFVPDSQIRGVILNQCSKMSYGPLKNAILERFQGRVKPLGFLPPMADAALESRHLGLVTAREVENLKEKLQTMARAAEDYIDLDGLLALSKDVDPIFYEDVEIPKFSESVRIAVAMDKAFCFYYGDNLTLLKEMGGEIVPFSPLEDSQLPQNIQGLYLGGGYPELYLEKLSQNKTMLSSIRQAAEKGLPILAECGGFMYLNKSIAGHPMVNLLPGDCEDQKKLTRFGYVTLTAKQDNLLCRAGEKIQGHEFHHWDSTENGSDFEARKLTGKHWDCVFAADRLYAGFPHFHFYSNLSFGKNFYETCLRYKGEHHD